MTAVLGSLSKWLFPESHYHPNKYGEVTNIADEEDWNEIAGHRNETKEGSRLNYDVNFFFGHEEQNHKRRQEI